MVPSRIKHKNNSIKIRLLVLVKNISSKSICFVYLMVIDPFYVTFAISLTAILTFVFLTPIVVAVIANNEITTSRITPRINTRHGTPKTRTWHFRNGR